MKFFRLAARCALWAVLSAVSFLAACQSSLIYFPRPYDDGDLRAARANGARAIEIHTSQGKQVAFYLPSRRNPSQPPEFLWILCGGNGALALDYAPDAAPWDGRFGYLFVDYPGYGQCEGTPNPVHIEESVVALARRLQSDFGWSDDEFSRRTGVFGHSLGCAAVLIAADRLLLGRAVLCAPFTTMDDMARRTVGWPLCLLNRHRFDNLRRLESLSARGGQVRIFHGTADEVIPVAMSRKIAGMFPKNVRLTEVPDSHHNEVVADAGGDIGRAMRELVETPPR